MIYSPGCTVQKRKGSSLKKYFKKGGQFNTFNHTGKLCPNVTHFTRIFVVIMQDFELSVGEKSLELRVKNLGHLVKNEHQALNRESIDRQVAFKIIRECPCPPENVTNIEKRKHTSFNQMNF